MLEIKVTDNVPFEVPSNNSLDWIPWLRDIAGLVGEIKLAEVSEGARLVVSTSEDGTYIIRPLNCVVTGYREREPKQGSFPTRRGKNEFKGGVTLEERDLLLRTKVTIHYNRVIEA